MHAFLRKWMVLWNATHEFIVLEDMKQVQFRASQKGNKPLPQIISVPLPTLLYNENFGRRRLRSWNERMPKIGTAKLQEDRFGQRLPRLWILTGERERDSAPSRIPGAECWCFEYMHSDGYDDNISSGTTESMVSSEQGHLVSNLLERFLVALATQYHESDLRYLKMSIKLRSHWSILRAMVFVPNGVPKNVTPSYSYDLAANQNDLLLPRAHDLINGVPELLTTFLGHQG